MVQVLKARPVNSRYLTPADNRQTLPLPQGTSWGQGCSYSSLRNEGFYGQKEADVAVPSVRPHLMQRTATSIQAELVWSLAQVDGLSAASFSSLAREEGHHMGGLSDVALLLRSTTILCAASIALNRVAPSFLKTLPHLIGNGSEKVSTSAR